MQKQASLKEPGAIILHAFLKRDLHASAHGLAVHEAVMGVKTFIGGA